MYAIGGPKGLRTSNPAVFECFNSAYATFRNGKICTTPAANPHNKNNPGIGHWNDEGTAFHQQDDPPKFTSSNPNKQKSKYENNTRLTCSSHGKKE